MKLKKLCMLLLTGVILFGAESAYSIPVSASEAAETQEASSQSFVVMSTGWRYKIENGYAYRRLYDYVDQCWIGDWELIGFVE